MNESPAIFSPSDGLTLHAFGETVIVKVSGEETGGAYAVALVTTPPGGGPPPHVHHREDETFFILEGRYEFLLNGAWTAVGPGATVYGPKGHVHTYRNIGETDARYWVLAQPSGFEVFFARCATVFGQSGPPDMAQIFQIAHEHGIEFVIPNSAER